jgi:hypothetical protein
MQLDTKLKELKHDLTLRPIHHQLEHRIEAHVYVYVVFLAYCLQVTLKAQLKQHAAGLTPRSVI